MNPMAVINRENKLLKNLLMMIGFGLLSYVMGKVRFYIPGVEGGTSDLSEIPVLLSVIYLPHWIYLVGITLMGSISHLWEPSQGSFLVTSIAHLVASVFAWYIYAFIKSRFTKTYIIGIAWSVMVLLYYFAFLSPLLIMLYYLFGYIPESRLSFSIMMTLKSVPLELFTCLTLTTSYIVLYHMNKRMEINNRDLSVALGKAEESDRLKSAFLANMSHEIRTPMNGIIGFSSLIADSDLTREKRREYLDIIVNSSNQLLDLINDILDISRIEAGQTEVNFENVSLNAVMDEIGLFYAVKAAERGIRFDIQKGLSDREDKVITDKGKLQQVLNNLLNNAFKFTREGSIHAGYERRGELLRFYVEDTGIGIDTQYHKKVFERFTQVDMADNREFGGTGLGLSISRGLVELLGGTIELASEPGKGSLFFFTIPFRNSNLDKKEDHDQDELPGGIKALAGHTVLIAEDESNNYLYMKEMLAEFGLNVLRAENGQQAVDLCKSNPSIDLVLMDIKMPVMNGYDATRQIRMIRPSLPVIAQTAYAMTGDRELAIDAGCNDYLTKPINKYSLLKSMLSCLEPGES